MVGPWARTAIDLLTADAQAERRTPLRHVPLPDDWPFALYVKDESARPTGSMKHGFARDLLIDALAGGRIGRHTPLVEATSGNMAVAEAYFARLLGLRFTAVVPAKTSPSKRARIEQHGGDCHPVDPPPAVYQRARELAYQRGGHYLDHLANLRDVVDARVTDRSYGPAAKILRDLADIGQPAPAWIVLGVGTGAGSRAAGRYLRHWDHPTRVAVVDPENSAYFPGWVTDCGDYATGMPSRIEGIGRPRMEPAFDGSVVDQVIPVPDAASVAAMRYLDDVMGLRAGPSTGACFQGACRILSRMRRDGVTGTVVLVAADSGEPYADTYYDDDWVAAKGWSLDGPTAELEHFMRTGVLEGTRGRR
ncbi:PLP-dependent cysteine synthase family protein [Umezawaea sp. NPDC059074]|uniref:PLP-dependent cysteine synthase family protein n=1 Tax=Umezawaea sp. NPDC059074 TaxID=3346716 RepID=UPI00367E3188